MYTSITSNAQKKTPPNDPSFTTPSRRKKSPTSKKLPTRKSREALLASVSNTDVEGHSNDFLSQAQDSINSTSAYVKDPSAVSTQYTLCSSFKATTASLSSPDCTQNSTSSSTQKHDQNSTILITGMENLPTDCPTVSPNDQEKQQKPNPTKAKTTCIKIIPSKKKGRNKKGKKALHNIIEVGMTVSGNFGELLPLPPNSPAGKRRVREKKIGKVMRCLGRNKWQIQFLDGNFKEKFSNSLTIERDIKFDDFKDNETKVQGLIPFPIVPEPNRNERSEEENVSKMSDGRSILDDDELVHVNDASEKREWFSSNKDVVDQEDDDSFHSMPSMQHRPYDYNDLESECSNEDERKEFREKCLSRFDKAEIEDMKKTHTHNQRMKDAKVRMKALLGKTFEVPGHTNKKITIKWTVIHKHEVEHPHPKRSEYSLGIRNSHTQKTIETSELPLAEMYFFLAFKDGNWWTKLGRFNSKIEEHNKQFRRTSKKYNKHIAMFTAKEFLICNALLIGAAAFKERGINLWRPNTTENNQWQTIAPPPEFHNYISFSKFKIFKQFIPSIWESETYKRAGDPWWQFAAAVDEFNEIRSQYILTSAERVLDESMSAYCPRTTRLGGLPNLSYVFRKPEPLGTEFKSSVCTVTKIMTHLEIQRGKYGMKDKEYNSSLGATAGCTLRMAKALSQSKIDGNIEIIMGDAWFGSVKAACHIVSCEEGSKKEAIFQIKTNSGGYPKKAMKEILQNEPGGTSLVMKAIDPETGVVLIATGYKYNTKTVLMFVCTEGAYSTTSGTPYLMKFPDDFGNTHIREVPRPELVSNFFKVSNVVDVHNQLRQYSLRLEKNG